MNIFFQNFIILYLIFEKKENDLDLKLNTYTFYVAFL